MAEQNVVDDMSNSLCISIVAEDSQELDDILSQIPYLEAGGEYTITDCAEMSMVEEDGEQMVKGPETETINEEEENEEKQLMEKKRKLDVERREVDIRLMEYNKKKNALFEEKQKAAQLLRFRKYPENKALDLLRELEKRAREARYAAIQTQKHSTALDKLVSDTRENLRMLACRRVKEEEKEKKSNGAAKH